MTRRSALLYYTAVSAFLLFLLEAFSGFVLWLAVSGGDGLRGGGRGGAEPPGREEFLTVTRSAWIDIHDWAGVALLVIIALHVVLHWRWIVQVTKRVFAAE
jgi:hypothetical protein